MIARFTSELRDEGYVFLRTPETILEGYEWLEKEDIRACLAYAHKLVEHERVELGINPAA